MRAMPPMKDPSTTLPDRCVASPSMFIDRQADAGWHGQQANGVQFCDMPKHRSGPTARYRLHGFDRICREQDIEHWLTKPNHPWTNGQVERMNRTLKDATVRRYHPSAAQRASRRLHGCL
jgi:transposase InsO family protein